MKLTEKDKKLLILLLFLVIGALYYKYVYTVQSEQLAQISQKKAEKEMQVFNMKNKINSMPMIEKNLAQEKKDILPLAKKYLGDVNQEDLILLINDYENQSDISIKSITFTEEDKIQIPEEEKEGNNPQGDKAGEAPKDPNAKEAAAPDRIKVTNADIKFVGTYTDLANLTKILDNSNKNIISNRLSIAKKEDGAVDTLVGKNPNDVVEGNLTLQFFRIPSIEKYEPTQPSILTNKIVPNTVHKSPIISDSYKVKQINNVTSTNTTSIIQNLDNTVREREQSLVPNIGNNNKKNTVEYNKPVELLRFDTLKNFGLINQSNEKIEDLILEKVKDINYNIVKIGSSAFEDDNNTKLLFDITKKDLTLNKQAESLSLNVYLEKPTNNYIGLIVRDANSQKKELKFADKLNFSGWKELSLHSSDLKYPIKVDYIYITNGLKDDSKKSSVYLDSLYANYVENK